MCVHKAWNLKRYNRNHCSYKWRLHRMITWKLLFDGEEIKFFTAKDLNLSNLFFWWGKWVNFWLLGSICPIPRVFHKASEDGKTVHTWWVQQFCDIFGKKGDVWHIILGDSPAGHGFVLRDLILIELFQISHNCVTECTLQTKFLLELI